MGPQVSERRITPIILGRKCSATINGSSTGKVTRYPGPMMLSLWNDAPAKGTHKQDRQRRGDVDGPGGRGGSRMHTVEEFYKRAGVVSKVRGEETPLCLTTTLYDLIAALQAVVGSDDDVLVVATVVHLLWSGRLTFPGKA
jgi:hypothetical protein